MQADRAVAIQFIRDMSGLDVSKSFEIVGSHGHIEFMSMNAPSSEAVELALLSLDKNLGVRRDTHYHNGEEYAWDLPNGRRVWIANKCWGDFSIGLVDFKAEVA